MRRVERLRHNANILVIVVFASEREALLGPRPLDHFEHLGKAFGAFAVGNAVGLVGAREAAATDPEDQPAMADMIDGGGIFRQPQWLAQWQNLDA